MRKALAVLLALHACLSSSAVKAPTRRVLAAPPSLQGGEPQSAEGGAPPESDGLGRDASVGLSAEVRKQLIANLVGRYEETLSLLSDETLLSLNGLRKSGLRHFGLP